MTGQLPVLTMEAELDKPDPEVLWQFVLVESQPGACCSVPSSISVLLWRGTHRGEQRGLFLPCDSSHRPLEG